MFRKLRIKFIAITMAMVTIVMVLAFTAVCVSEYQRSLSVVQTALSDAVEGVYNDNNAGRFGMDGGTPPAFPNENGAMGYKEADSGESSSADTSTTASSTTASSAASIADSSQSLLSDFLSVKKAYAAETDATDTGNAQGTQDGLNGNGETMAPQGDNQQDQVFPNQYPNQNPGQNPGQYGAPDSGQNGSMPQYDDQSADGSGEYADTGNGNYGGDNAYGGNGGNNGNGGNGGESYGYITDERYDGYRLSEENLTETTRPTIGIREGQQRNSNSLVPVAVFIADAEGTLKVVPETTSASISTDLLVEAAALALESGNDFGTIDSLGLHYFKKGKDDGSTILAFADTSYTDNWKSLAFILILAGLGTLVVLFFISLFFSKWALKPVREAWDSQRQFVADASHDLKTPLTVILANASILLKHPEHTIASESQWIESTQVEADNMQGLVNEMLELAQIEAGGQVQITMEELDFSDLVDGETLLFDSVALERNCTFNCSIEAGINVNGNAQRLQKMVSTIIENAFKYVDENGTIDIDLEKRGKTATLNVRNSGSIISAEDLPHIFDRFYRTDKARTSGAGGFGLGLAIAREIARTHGGDITCKSNDAEGTTFSITLPTA